MGVTRLARSTSTDSVAPGDDGKGKFLWITHTNPVRDPENGTDHWSVLNNKASITPLQTDPTFPASVEGAAATAAPGYPIQD